MRGEPPSLTLEQLLPIALAGLRREAAIREGLQFLLPPLPDCPSCHTASAELSTSQDYSFALDVLHLAFKPCGHRFTATGDDIYEAYRRAQQIVDRAPISKENEA